MKRIEIYTQVWNIDTKKYYLKIYTGFQIDETSGIYKSSTGWYVVDLPTGMLIVAGHSGESKQKILNYYADADLQKRLADFKLKPYYKKLMEQFQTLKKHGKCYRGENLKKNLKNY